MSESDSDSGESKPTKPTGKKKATVGRPPKKIERNDIPMRGIVSEPSNFKTAEDPALIYAVELIYENTGMFKKIFNLFKNLKVESIHIRFQKDAMHMYSKDKSGESDIYVNIYGHKMNSYYAKQEYTMTCNIASFKKRMQNMSKEASEMNIYSNENDIDKSLFMNFCGASQVTKSKDRVNIVPSPSEDPWSEIDAKLAKEKYYGIQFELGSKHFKELINSYNHIEEFKILKSGSDILKFVYDYADDQGDHEDEFPYQSKINLISNLNNDDVFAINVTLSRIKSLVSSIIAPNIHISADENGPLIFTLNLDETLNEKTKLPFPRSEKACIKIVTSIDS